MAMQTPAPILHRFRTKTFIVPVGIWIIDGTKRIKGFQPALSGIFQGKAH